MGMEHNKKKVGYASSSNQLCVLRIFNLIVGVFESGTNRKRFYLKKAPTNLPGLFNTHPHRFILFTSSISSSC